MEKTQKQNVVGNTWKCVVWGKSDILGRTVWMCIANLHEHRIHLRSLFGFNKSGWGLTTCISNGLLGNTAGLGPHCEEQNLADKASFQKQQAEALVSSEKGCKHYRLEPRMPSVNVTYKVIKVVSWLLPLLLCHPPNSAWPTPALEPDASLKPMLISSTLAGILIRRSDCF